jgi:hypothetical protein
MRAFCQRHLATQAHPMLAIVLIWWRLARCANPRHRAKRQATESNVVNAHFEGG